MDIYRFIPDLNIPDNEKPKYIIIDEVQDITPSMFNALKHVISSNGYWNVFGDLAQNIFGQKLSWRNALGININKIYRLKMNYRNSYEIGLFSKQILDHIKQFQQELHNSISDMDDPLLSDRHSNTPQIKRIDNIPIRNLCAYINNMKQEGSTAIICMDRNDVIKIISMLKNDNIEYCTNLKNYEKYDGVFVQSINQIKGMEFDNVIVYGIDLSDRLEDRPEIINSDNTLNVNVMNTTDKLTVAERIYVSTTRTRDNLLLLYRNNPLMFLF